ncbi:MAG: DUF2975 domain-containing protein [Peptococcaceae bacterium]|jgi:hypothetical protein|nr:DUF2975 domain-containing protein [Peptococcaceae bacterium]
MTSLFLLLVTAGALGMPLILNWYIGYAGKNSDIYLRLLYTLRISAIPAFIALICLGRLLKNIDGGQIFVSRNVRLLRILSWCCFTAAGIFLVMTFNYVTGLFVVISAAFMGLILRVVKNVIAQAIELKQENDLTV